MQVKNHTVTNFRLAKAVRRKLEAIAAVEGVTMTSIVERLIAAEHARGARRNPGAYAAADRKAEVSG